MYARIICIFTSALYFFYSTWSDIAILLVLMSEIHTFSMNSSFNRKNSSKGTVLGSNAMQFLNKL